MAENDWHDSSHRHRYRGCRQVAAASQVNRSIGDFNFSVTAQPRRPKSSSDDITSQVNGHIDPCPPNFFQFSEEPHEPTLQNVGGYMERQEAPHPTVSGFASIESPRDLNLPGVGSVYGINSGRAFEYQKLSQAKEIRVLQILPGSKPDPIRVALSHRHIDSEETYEAISYAWGNKVTVTVSCEGKQLEIPQSLHEVFRELRHPWETRCLWADAVCINQVNNDEKSHQVRLMTAIYRHAKKVIVWLGHKDAHCAQMVFACSYKVFHGNFTEVPRGAEMRNGFSSLFELPWFERIWCFQEIVLATSAVVMWGTETIAWEQLGFTAAWIRNTDYEVLQQLPLQGAYNASLMLSMSNSYPVRKRYSFIDLMMLTRQFKASDDRDRIYGLLGVQTIGSSPESGSLYVDPDYTKTSYQLYEEFAMNAIESCKNLTVLSAVQHGLSIEDSKTWVPQWNTQYTRPILPFGLPIKNFSASSRIRQMSPTPTDTVMIVYGMDYDVVTSTSDFIPSPDDLSDELWRIQDLWDTLVASLGDHIDTPDLALAFSVTITGGKHWYGAIIAPEDNAYHLADFEAFLEHKSMNEPDSTESQALARAVHSALLKEGTTGATGHAKRFMEAMFQVLCNRRFFVTRRGHIGIGPACMRTGDAVCILSGADVPFIIRKSGEDHLLAGEAYVHGIMHGEACGKFDCGSTALTEFRLR